MLTSVDIIGETTLTFDAVKQGIYRETVAEEVEVPVVDVIILGITDIETRRRSALQQRAVYRGIRIDTSIVAATATSADDAVVKLTDAVNSGEMAKKANVNGLNVELVGIGAAAVGGDSDKEAFADKVRPTKLFGTAGVSIPRRLIAPRTLTAPTAPLSSAAGTLPPPPTNAGGYAFTDLSSDKDAMGGLAIGLGIGAALIITAIAFAMKRRRNGAKQKRLAAEEQASRV